MEKKVSSLKELLSENKILSLLVFLGFFIFSYTGIQEFFPTNNASNFKNVSSPTSNLAAAVEGTSFRQGPVLFFSDLESGPNTGNTDTSLGQVSGQDGAIVSVWGDFLESSQGASSVTVNGAPAKVYYWGDAVPPYSPANLNNGTQKMQIVIFQVNHAAASGLGQITVTVNNQTSNPLPFTVRSGKIFFTKTSGSDTTGNGSFSTPWQTIHFAKDKVSAGDILYAGDGSVALPVGSNESMGLTVTKIGVASSPIALVAYPGAQVTIGSNKNDGIVGYIADSVPVQPEYWTFAKLAITGLSVAVRTRTGWRLVGNKITDPNGDGALGTVSTGGGRGDLKIFGNEFTQNGKAGGSSLYHVLYISANPRTDTPPRGAPATNIDIGWNYFHDNLANRAINIYNQGLYSAFQQGPIIHDNLIVNQKGDAILLGWHTTGDVWVYNNVIINAGLGPFDDGQRGPYTCINFSNGHASLGKAGTTAHVYNNTLLGCGWKGTNEPMATGALHFHTSESNYDIHNNLISSPFLYVTGSSLTLNVGAEPILPPRNPSYISNNLWFGSGVPPAFETNAVNADPQLNGVSLGAKSPAIHAGVVAPAIAARDFYGVLRSGPSDIGAIQSGSSATTNIPAPPVVTPVSVTPAPVVSVPDTQAPSTPTNLTATGISTSQVTLTWSPSTDNVKVVKYRIYRERGSTVTPPLPQTVPVVTIAVIPTSGTVNVVNPQLEWSATNSPTSCTASGDWSGTKTAKGTISQGVLSIARTYTFTLICANASGTSVPKTATIVVTQPVTPSSGTRPSSSTRPQTTDSILLPLISFAPSQYAMYNVDKKNVTLAWNGAAFDYTTRTMYIPVAGGHGDWYPNQSFAFSVDTGKWTEIHPMTPFPPTGTGFEANGVTPVIASVYDDGQPSARHIYGGTQYLPTQGKVWLISGATWPSGRYDTYTGWLDPVTGKWQTKNPVPRGFSGITSAYDAKRDQIVWGAVGTQFVYIYDPKTDTNTLIPRAQGDILGAGTSYYTSFQIDPVGDYLYATSLYTPDIISWFGANSSYKSSIFRLKLGQTTPQKFEPVAITGNTAAVFGKAPGFEYDPERHAFVFWDYTDPTAVTILSLDTFVATRVPVSISPKTDETLKGVWGRFRRYAPNQYVLMVGPDYPVQFITLPPVVGGTIAYANNIPITIKKGFFSGLFTALTSTLASVANSVKVLAGIGSLNSSFIDIASPTTTYQDSGLTPSTTYFYTIEAFDAAGNVSGRSNLVSVTTLTQGAAMVQTQTLPTTPPQTTQQTTPPVVSTPPSPSSGGGGAGSYTLPPPSLFTQTLEFGAEDIEVRELQKFLNNHNFIVTTSGPGSKGNETTYFGPATRAALIRFQTQYLSTIAEPERGTTSGMTRTKLNELAATDITTSAITPSPTLSTTYTFSRNLRMGMRGEDVRALQQFLNTNGYIITLSGPGSKGNETTYFGPATKNAVIKFQEAYQSELLIPVGLVNGSGFVGALTRGKLEGI